MGEGHFTHAFCQRLRVALHREDMWRFGAAAPGLLMFRCFGARHVIISVVVHLNVSAFGVLVLRQLIALSAAGSRTALSAYCSHYF